ncbi:related to integral membrane protein pth11 [Cephalotrichum gorgonifer]|uniref:Related to integral membrane protein pth11 n=1 Tax=Cephalotrichum gorgonifer TaxID=2041049 RepID=A0AAE8N183_9PEZI|nr:related to integral membrane protein pth11 [Cephalotrichum gorgonifer]
MKSDAPWALSVMWSLTSITLVFVILRLYTRVAIVKTFGADDATYNNAFVLQLIFTVFTQLSANHGFGQSMSEIGDAEDVARAVLLEVIGQTFAAIGMAVAKWSLGLFLLRFVNINMIWHRTAIWTAMAGLMLTSISVAVIFWLQCNPPAYLRDRRIPRGFCHIDTIPVAFTLCIYCVVVDFFFAILPWISLWNLTMNRREKILIAGS